MSENPLRVVFDCNIFVQSMLNPVGPAGACVQHALNRGVQLFLSQYILQEIREAPDKPTPARLGVTGEKVERLIANLLMVTMLVDDVPRIFEHPIDADDAHYIDLAVATQTTLIISRDRHLLGLSDPAKPWSREFRQRFPDLRIIAPELLLEMLRRP